jgi:hypothetical protein
VKAGMDGLKLRVDRQSHRRIWMFEKRGRLLPLLLAWSIVAGCAWVGGLSRWRRRLPSLVGNDRFSRP